MRVTFPIREPKLVLQSSIESGQGLREAVQKACKLNGFKHTSVALELAGCRSARRLSALAVSDNAAELRAVSKLLGIEDENELLATVLSSSKEASRDFVSFFGHNVRRGHIARTRRISPQSLKSKPEMKAIWALKPLSFDPTNREKLLDRCPSCQSILGWDWSLDPWICEHCSLDLRSVPMPMFEPSDPEALDFVAYMLDPTADGRRVHLPTGSTFSSGSYGDLFQLAVRIATTCQRSRDTTSPVQIEPGHVQMAGRAILDWPNGFLELVESTPAQADSGQAASWFKEKPLRQLLYDPTLSSAIRNELTKTFEVHRRREGLTRGDALVANAAKTDLSRERLQHPRAALLRLLRTRNIEMRPRPTFETVMTVLRDVSEVRQFAKETGVPIPEVWRLYWAGFAPELVSALSYYGWCAQPVLEGTLRSAVNRVISTSLVRGGLDLVSARFALDPQMKSSWSSIFQAVFDGRLEVGSGPSNGSLVGGIYVKDCHSLRTIIMKERSDPDVAHSILTQEEFSMLMRKSRIYAAHLVRSGVMNGPSNLETFARLRERWAFGFELDTLAAITGSLTSCSSKRLRNARVDRIDFGPATLWSREQALSVLAFDHHESYPAQ